jgi:hypothetical protein
LLQREWAARLRRSGFQDLEPVPDGKLSNRGNSYDHDVADGEEYYAAAKAMDVSRLDPLSRRAWQLHADKQSIRSIMATLGTRYNQTRDLIIAARTGNQVKEVNQCRKPKLRALIRQSETATLVELVTLLTGTGYSKT